MKQVRYFLILNPGSRSGTARRHWPAILDDLTSRQVNYDFAVTQKAGDGTTLAAKAAADGYDVVVAVGGDGTINEVMSGLFVPGQQLASAGFGVIYTGTSPDFCHYHNIPLDHKKAVDYLVNQPHHNVDVCSIIHGDDTGKQLFRIFGCSSNLGIGAAIARGSNTGLRTMFGDAIGTFFSMLQAIFNYKRSTFIFRCDGKNLRIDNVWNLFIGKNPFIASGIKLKLDIKPDDGKFYLMALHSLTPMQLLLRLPKVYTGTLTTEFPPIYCQECIVFDGGENHEVEYDGDPQGFLPARIRILPRALPIHGISPH